MISISKAFIGAIAMVVIGVLGIGSVNTERMLDIIEKHNEA